MRRATGAAVAGVLAVVCALVLSGCRDNSVASQSVNSVVTPSSTGAAAANGTADGAATSAPGDTDSDLNAVDSQLAGLDSAMAQATQSPSDGG